MDFTNGQLIETIVLFSGVIALAVVFIRKPTSLKFVGKKSIVIYIVVATVCIIVGVNIISWFLYIPTSRIDIDGSYDSGHVIQQGGSAGGDKPFSKGGGLSIDKPFDKGGALSIDKPHSPPCNTQHFVNESILCNSR